MPIPRVQLNLERRSLPRDLAWVGAVPLVLLPFFVFISHGRWPAWLFMWGLSLSIFAGLKWLTWWQAPRGGPGKAVRSLLYLTAWPGMDADAFLDVDRTVPKPQAREWAWALFKTALGIVLLWNVARRMPTSLPLLQAWIGLFGLIFLLHFGSFHLLSLFWREIGIAAEPIMCAPIRSSSLSDFWGKRWNLGFRQLAHDFIFRPLHKRTGVAAASLLVFLASGLIHELVISVPARGGYGLPTAYFLLQGLGVALERSRAGQRLGLQQGFSGWVFMFVLTAGPAFWLFHPPFALRVIVPFMYAIYAL